MVYTGNDSSLRTKEKQGTLITTTDIAGRMGIKYVDILSVESIFAFRILRFLCPRGSGKSWNINEAVTRPVIYFGAGRGDIVQRCLVLTLRFGIAAVLNPGFGDCEQRAPAGAASGAGVG